MKILCTHPGKYGDLLWALPTIRALWRKTRAEITLMVPETYASILRLLLHQPYIQVVTSEASWEDPSCQPDQRWSPPRPTRFTTDWDYVIHLGYRTWPSQGLPFETLKMYGLACAYNMTAADATLPEILPSDLDLQTPWITMPGDRYTGYHWPWLYGFSDDHFELKFGLVQLLQYRWRAAREALWPASHSHRQLPATTIGRNPRWEAEAGCTPATWEDSVDLLRHASCLLACNSALHVLAVACGVPVVLMEPAEARWNPIFLPLGTHGPQVTLVYGNDGKPTFDARHTAAALEAVVARALLATVQSSP